MHIKDWLAAQTVSLPLASGDSRLVMDLDFRTGLTAITSALTTALGGAPTHGATGEQWDTTLGWNPGRTGYFVKTGWTPPAGTDSNFTIYLEVRKQDIASTCYDNDSSFLDNLTGPTTWSGSGGYSGLSSPYSPTPGGATINGYIFQWGMGAGNFDNMQALYSVSQAAGPGAMAGRFQFNNRSNASSNAGQLTIEENSDYLSDEDQYVKVAIVIRNGKEEHYFINGLWRGSYQRTATANSSAASTVFGSFRLSDDGSNTNGFVGWIRRFQLISGGLALNEVYSGPNLAFIGDSYVQRGSAQATPAGSPPSVAQINAVQNGLNSTNLANLSTSTINPVKGGSITPWIVGMQKQAAKQGARFKYYAAGDAGHDWSSGGAQIRTNFFTAVSTYDPEILVCLGSVNDVANASDPATMVANIKSLLTSVSANCRNLRKILFIETFPPFLSAGATFQNQSVYESQIAAMASGLPGYAVTTKDSRTVTVQYVPVYSALGGSSYNPAFHLDSHPAKANWKTLTGSTSEDSDVHPGQFGMNRMIEIIWPALSPYLLNAAMYYS